MLNARLSACVSTVLAAMLSLFTSAASIRLVLGNPGASGFRISGGYNLYTVGPGCILFKPLGIVYNIHGLIYILVLPCSVLHN